MTAKPIPDGYHSVTPYLTVRGATKAIDFLKQAFSAQISHEPLKRPDGTIRAKWLRPPRPRFIYTFRTSTEFFNRRSRPVAQKLWNRRICSTVTAAAA